MRSMKYGVAAMAMSMTLMVPLALADEGGRWGELVGTWLVKLAPADCVTGNPVPIPPIVTLFTFHEDGTLSASMQNYAATLVNRSLSHGTWRRKPASAPGAYTMKFIHLRYDFVSGIYLGTQEAVSQVALNGTAERFTASSTTRGFDPSGALQYSSCAMLSGERTASP
jgi:hypothetical protein